VEAWVDYLLQAFITALKLIIYLDSEVIQCTMVSLKISCSAVLLATIAGIPLSFLIALNEFKGKRALITLFNTMMALPTVVVGLFVFSAISRQGPLGVLGLLFTPTAMLIGQFILATPIIIALSISAIRGVDPRIRVTALSLGARSHQVVMTLILEARFAIMAAIIAGFGRIIGEVGSAMMLGGNIRGYTRSITTAIALETSKGEFSLGLALGIILLTVALSVNILLRSLQQQNS
jgi:tungstate transport system permease protein